MHPADATTFIIPGTSKDALSPGLPVAGTRVAWYISKARVPYGTAGELFNA